MLVGGLICWYCRCVVYVCGLLVAALLCVGRFGGFAFGYGAWLCIGFVCV